MLETIVKKKCMLEFRSEFNEKKNPLLAVASASLFESKLVNFLWFIKTKLFHCFKL